MGTYSVFKFTIISFISLLILPYCASSLNFNDALILLGINRDQILNPHSIHKRDSGRSNSVQVYSFKVQSDVKFRYSRTCVTSRLLNRNARSSDEVTFQVVLPETAFISKFSMEIDGKVYEAYVKEKDQAKRVYKEAQSRGQSAGLVELNMRDTNVFNVNVNIRAESKVSFNLTYEELLQRRLGRYEQSINISPDQYTRLEDVEITVNIQESQDITLIHVPNLRNEIELEDTSDNKNSEALVEKLSSNSARITWHPSATQERKLRDKGGIGKFVFQYDVKRDIYAGEILIMNGYFVHFFSPTNVKPLRKHVVFVLDISGSMMGRKIEQMKDAMRKILNDLREDDFFNIIIFASSVAIWTPGDVFQRQWPKYDHRFMEPLEVNPLWKKHPYPATRENIQLGIDFVMSLPATDGTNIHDALLTAFDLVLKVKHSWHFYKESDSSRKYQNNPRDIPPPSAIESMVIFLTDGEPTVGITDPQSIWHGVRSSNAETKAPLFALAFGDSADFYFLRRVALQNFGFARKIYEAADAVIQLKGFYNEISSPLLSKVKFNYTSPDYDVDDVTSVKFPVLYGGSELAVAGKIIIKVPQNSEEAVTERKRRSTRLNKPTGIIKFAPDDHCYFPLSVDGIARDGPATWVRPIVYIPPHPHPYPWWCHPHPHPYPPPPPITTTTKRPPVVTQEEFFLERLWAYLTVQQLVDFEYSQSIPEKEKEVYPVTQEPPREKALRVALKYGFVTALTSLVVVKPDGNDETGAISTDKSRTSNSGSFSDLAIKKSFATNGGTSHIRRNSFAKDSGQSKATNYDSVDGKERKSEKTDYAEDTRASQSTKAPKKIKDRQYFTLYDILWLTNDLITVDSYTYHVAQEGFNSSTTGGTDVGRYCSVKRGRRTLAKKGECKHLKDCVQSAFMDEFEAYQKAYFCAIQDLKVDDYFYAGACCPKYN